MVSETFFTGYFWAIYVWFAIGALIIGIPAIIQIVKFLTAKPDADKGTPGTAEK